LARSQGSGCDSNATLATPMTSLQPTVDEAHRFIPEYRGECPQAGRYFDSQAAISNGIHALWDRLFGKEAVAALDDHPREAAYFATCSLAMVVALYASRSVLNAVWPDFAKITPRHKQMYVLMNLMKSLLLGAQATSFSWLWYSSKEYGCTLNPLGFNLRRRLHPLPLLCLSRRLSLPPLLLSPPPPVPLHAPSAHAPRAERPPAPDPSAATGASTPATTHTSSRSRCCTPRSTSSRWLSCTSCRSRPRSTTGRSRRGCSG